MGLINWAKYTKIIIDAEKEFIDIYNFQLPIEDRNPAYARQIVITEIFERCRNKKLTPDNVTELITGLKESSSLYKALTYDMPNNRTMKMIASNYGSAYFFYVSYRAAGLSPLESSINARESYFDKANVDFVNGSNKGVD